MPIALTSLLLHVGADTKEAESGLDKVNSHVQRMGVLVGESSAKFTGGMSSVTGGITGAIKSTLGFGLALGGTVYAVKSLTEGAISLGGALLKPNAALEQSRIAFKGLLGSAQAANAFLKDMQQFAASTPFEFPELVTASQHMLAFGFQAKQIKPLLTSIGDAMSAMGQGADSVDAVVRVFGQMHAATKVTTQDMYQLTNFGIPAFDMLAKGMGKTVPELQKMISQGLVPADKAIGILQASFDKSFGGSMAQQSRSFNGLLSTLADNARLALTSFTGPLFDRAKTSLDKLGQAVSSPAFQNFAETLGVGVGNALDTLGKKFDDFKSIVGQIGDSLKPLKQIVDQVRDTFTPLTQYVLPGFAESLPKINLPLSTFTKLLDQLVNGALVQFSDIWTSLGPALAESGPVLVSMAQGSIQLVQALSPLTELLNPILTVIKSLIPELAPLIPLFLQIAAQIQGALIRNLQLVVPQVVKLVDVLLTGLHPVFVTIIDVVKKLAPVIGDLLTTALDTLGPIIAQVVGLLADHLGPILADLAPILAEVISAVGDWIAQLATDLMPLIQAVGQLLMKILPPAFDFIGARVQFLFSIFKAVWPLIQTIVDVAMTNIRNVVHIVTDLISGNWSQLGKDLMKFAQDSWNGIIRIIGSAVTAVWNVIKAIAQPILDAILKPFQMARDTVGAIWKALANFGIDAINSFVIKSFNQFIGNIAKAVDWVADHLHAGKPLADAEKGVIGNIPKFAKGGVMGKTGWALVGEEGPELAYLTAGSRVWSNAQSYGPHGFGGNVGGADDNGNFDTSSGQNPISTILGTIDDWFMKGTQWLVDKASQAFNIPKSLDVPPFGNIAPVFLNAMKNFFDNNLLAGGDISGAMHSAGAHWWLSHITQGFHDPRNPAHGGIDFGIGFHTPLAALLGGVVMRAGYHPWGGELDLWTNLPGFGRGLENYTHLDLINPAFLHAGAFVPSGAIVGLSGGENPGWPGGLHPALRQFSSGPHFHYNWFRNAPWAHDDLNPTPFINSLRGAAAPRRGFAGGGWINEPVVGWGLHSGGAYTFAEEGSEYVSPHGRGGGAPIIIHATTADEKRLGKNIARELVWQQQIRGRW